MTTAAVSPSVAALRACFGGAILRDRVLCGDTIVWVNKDLVPHTATSKAGGFDSQLVAADKSWRFTVQKQGDFAYVCTFHPTMTAMLRVK